MINTANTIIDEGKKSLETLLREKAYEDVSKKLRSNGIDINDVNEDDIEALVAARADDMRNGIKGFAVGTAFAIALSMVTGF